MLGLLRLPLLQPLRLLLMFLLHLLHALRRSLLPLHLLVFLLLTRLQLLPLFLLLVVELLPLLLIFLIKLRIPGIRRGRPLHRRKLIRMRSWPLIFRFRLLPAIFFRPSIAPIRGWMIFASCRACGYDAIPVKFGGPRCGRYRRSPMILIRPQLWI